MSHDHDGNADDPRIGQQQEAAAGSNGISKPDGRTRAIEASGDAGATDDRRSAGIEKIAEIADILEGEGETILEAFGMTKIQHREIAYSGAIIPPILLENCDPETKERYLRMMEWDTVDESRRQDRLVDNEIEQAKKGPVRTMVMLGVFAGLSFASFLATESEWSFTFLSVPIVSIIGNLVSEAHSKSSRPRERSNPIPDQKSSNSE